MRTRVGKAWRLMVIYFTQVLWQPKSSFNAGKLTLLRLCVFWVMDTGRVVLVRCNPRERMCSCVWELRWAKISLNYEERVFSKRNEYITFSLEPLNQIQNTFCKRDLTLSKQIQDAIHLLVNWNKISTGRKSERKKWHENANNTKVLSNGNKKMSNGQCFH